MRRAQRTARVVEQLTKVEVSPVPVPLLWERSPQGEVLLLRLTQRFPEPSANESNKMKR